MNIDRLLFKRLRSVSDDFQHSAFTFREISQSLNHKVSCFTRAPGNGKHLLLLGVTMLAVHLTPVTGFSLERQLGPPSGPPGVMSECSAFHVVSKSLFDISNTFEEGVA